MQIKNLELFLNIDLKLNDEKHDLWENSYRLGDNGDVQALFLSNVRVKQMEDLGSELNSFPNLKELTIEDSDDLKSLNFLNNFKNLESLKIINTSITELVEFSQLENLKKLIITNLKFLDLSHLGVAKEMITLELKNIKLIDTSKVLTLRFLKLLSIEHSKIKDIVFLEELEELRLLQFIKCDLKTIPSLGKKNHLHTFHLREDSVRLIDESFFQEYQSIRDFNLGYNQLENLLFLKHMPSLESLWLLHNPTITNFDLISSLSKLTSLSCGNCDVKNLSFLKDLVHLKRIDLQENEIKDVSQIRNLKNIRKLNLKKNKIRKLTALKCYDVLSELQLQNNPIVEFPRWVLATNCVINWDPYGLSEKAIIFYNNPFKNIPVEIIERGKDAIIRYFEKIDSEGAEVIYEVKVTLVGEGGAGKTSLKRRLINDKASLPRKDTRTRGIEIKDWTFKEVNGVKHKAHIWDFGGQDVYYPVHRFFITENSVFILLASTRQTHHNFDYWIPTIYQFGGSSPIILSQTCHDGNKKSWNDLGNYISSQNFNIIKTQINPYYELELTNKNRGLLKLKKVIIDQIMSLPHYGRRVPKTWSKVRNRLKKEAKLEACITFEKFVTICKEISLDGFLNTSDVVDCCHFLHSIGVVIWYSKSDILKNWVVLDPQWAMNAVYLIIDDKEIQDRKGRITGIDFERLWNDDSLILKHFVLKSMLENFKIAFPKRHSSSEYLMPARMNSIPNEERFKIKEPFLSVIFRFKFMPKGIVNQVSAELSRYIESENSVWNNSVNLVYDDKTTIANVYENFYSREIVVRSKGQNARGLIMIIIDAIIQVVSEYRGVENQIYVPCICSTCQNSPEPNSFSYSKLVDWYHERKNKPVVCNESGDKILISELLYSVGLENEIKTNDDDMVLNKRNPKKVFISYSKFDEDYLNDMQDHLVTLKSEGLATFDCREIGLGAKWDETIKKEIDECDIMICLISVKFLNTDYISKIEIPKAIEQNKIIVPIIIKSCDWESSPLGKYQAASRGKIVSLNNHSRLSGKIESHTDEEKAAFWTDIIKEIREKLF